jgi:hypothetical protein
MKILADESGEYRLLDARPSRREWLLRAGGGFGALGLAALLDREAVSAPGSDSRPAWRVAPRAKRLIFVFLEGGPSHIDLFDPKPLLDDLAGKPLPPSFKPVVTSMGEFHSPVLAPKRTWARHGKGGLWISDWLPHLARRADDLCVVRSCWANGLNHAGGVCQMNTGSILAGRPSLGSWVSYGLGTENANMPAYVVLLDDPKTNVIGGPRNWGAGFMSAAYQGTRIEGGDEPIKNLRTPAAVGGARQKAKLELLSKIESRYAEGHPAHSEIEARIRSYELAFRMQAEAPDTIDLSNETDETRELYGMNQPETAVFGHNCLLARRLVERGVRFVQLYHGAGSKWDAHSGIEQNHTKMCKGMDKPVAGLLADLKRRGLLEDTLVVIGGEFGRTPMSEKGDGRDHNPYGFTMVLAGAGVVGGRTIGATDEIGLHAIEERIHVHDFHATLLWLMGVDHEKLVWLHKGRPERATMNEGAVVDAIARV